MVVSGACFPTSIIAAFCKERPLVFAQKSHWAELAKWRLRASCKTNVDVIKPYSLNWDCCLVFSSACVYTVVLHALSIVRASTHPSVNSCFSDTVAWIQAKFYGKLVKLPIHNISRTFLSFFQILQYVFVILVKISKRYSSLSFRRISTNFTIIC